LFFGDLGGGWFQGRIRWRVSFPREFAADVLQRRADVLREFVQFLGRAWVVALISRD
jgi:hypothetical protein